MREKSADAGKVSSIARKMNIKRVFKQIGIFFTIDVMLLLTSFFAMLVCLDRQYLGKFEWDLTRRIVRGDSAWELTLQCGGAGEAGAYSVTVGPGVEAAMYVLMILVVLELLYVLHQILFGANQIRHELRPIRDMAQRARALSEMPVDERHFEKLEQAISDLHVEQPDEHITGSDKELVGIEQAINRLLDRMRESNRRQTQFVSDASHELRTPIAVIQGYINMLDRWGKEDEAVLSESIEAIKHESAHMQKLVEQLLFLARGDSNRQKMEKKEIELGAILREVYEESRMIDEAHLYRLEMSGEVFLFGDPDLIKQSVRILTDNAAKYTAEGEEIVLRAGVRDDGAPFYGIQDNGIGMSAEDVEHAFDRFYRADSVRESKTGGTGLGLAIAKWIVDQHGGYYEVVSRENIGTRFTVIFPDGGRMQDVDHASRMGV